MREIDTGGKLVGIVEEPTIAVILFKVANKRRVSSAKAVCQGDVVTVIELTEPRPQRPLSRSSGIPSHAHSGREPTVIVVA